MTSTGHGHPVVRQDCPAAFYLGGEGGEGKGVARFSILGLVSEVVYTSGGKEGVYYTYNVHTTITGNNAYNNSSRLSNAMVIELTLVSFLVPPPFQKTGNLWF